MEYPSVVYWKKFAARGEAIEHLLNKLELMTKYRPQKRGMISATNATYFLYVSVGLLWVFLICVDLFHSK